MIRSSKVTHEGKDYVFQFYLYNYIKSQQNIESLAEIATILMCFQEEKDVVKITAVDYVENLRNHLGYNPLYMELYNSNVLAVMEPSSDEADLKEICESLSKRFLGKECPKSTFYANLLNQDQK